MPYPNVWTLRLWATWATHHSPALIIVQQTYLSLAATANAGSLSHHGLTFHCLPDFYPFMKAAQPPLPLSCAGYSNSVSVSWKKQLTSSCLATSYMRLDSYGCKNRACEKLAVLCKPFLLHSLRMTGLIIQTINPRHSKCCMCITHYMPSISKSSAIRNPLAPWWNIKESPGNVPRRCQQDPFQQTSGSLESVQEPGSAAQASLAWTTSPLTRIRPWRMAVL